MTAVIDCIAILLVGVWLIGFVLQFTRGGDPVALRKELEGPTPPWQIAMIVGFVMSLFWIGWRLME
jgi:hypothetical protein